MSITTDNSPSTRAVFADSASVNIREKSTRKGQSRRSKNDSRKNDKNANKEYKEKDPTIEEPAVQRTFLNHESYPDINVFDFRDIDDFLDSMDDYGIEHIKAIQRQEEGYSEDEVESEEEAEELTTGHSIKHELDDIYDLDQSRSPAPSTFDCLESQLKYELNKCISSLEPQYRISTFKNKSESSELIDGNNSMVNDIDSASNKRNNKNKEPNYTYLSVKEILTLMDRREYTLISIDNEFYERSTSKVTEIGISIYNPTYQKFAFFPHIFNIHFIIKEFVNLRNGAFVPDSKMNNMTGQSLIISKNDIPKAMSLIFEILGPKICIVGHNVKGDLASFKNLKYSIPTNLKIIDTVNLWYSFVGSKSGKSSLTYVLDRLSIPNAFLHNGVNDAYYTLVACLMLTSPESRNNLIFKKKPVEESKLDESSDGEGTSEETDEKDEKEEKQPPDFSEFPPDIAEIKLKRWYRKQEKAKAKKKKKKELNEKKNKIHHIRCSIEPTAISKKQLSGTRNKKNPPVNKFFKPEKYDESKLLKGLNELNV